jgi:hypothetical protein
MDRGRRCIIAIARHVRALGFSIFLLVFTAMSANADGVLAKPQGDVILSIRGAIKTSNAIRDGNLVAEFDHQLLESMEMVQIKTQSPFVEGMHTFKGVLLKDLLTRIGAHGTILCAAALDGYSVDIPIGDAAQFDVVLALIWNGKYMTPRDKGPIWMIYPISKFPELNTEMYSSSAIWQLTDIVVEP